MNELIDEYVAFLRAGNNSCELEFRMHKRIAHLSDVNQSIYDINMDLIRDQGKDKKVVTRYTDHYIDGKRTNDKSNITSYVKRTINRIIENDITLVLANEEKSPVQVSPISASIIKFTRRYRIESDQEYSVYFDVYKIYGLSTHHKGELINPNGNDIADKKKLFIGTPNDQLDTLIEIEYNNKYVAEHSYTINDRQPYTRYIINDDTARKIISLLGVRSTINDVVKEVTQDVKTLDIHTYRSEVFDHINEWIMLNKTDGVKMLLYVSQGKTSYITNSKVDFNISLNHVGTLIIEGEYDGNFYAYDLLYDERLCTMPYNERLIRLGLIIDAYSAEQNASSMRLKRYYDLGKMSLDQALASWKKAIDNKEEPSDGLIFTHKTKPLTYKWKDTEHNTIDFYARRYGTSGTYYLYAYIRTSNRAEIGAYREKTSSMSNTMIVQGDKTFVLFYANPTMSSNVDIDGKIVEVNLVNGMWHYHRTRDDKSYPNALRTVENIYVSYFSPFKYEYLLNPPDVYFKNEKDDIYRAAIYYNSMVKGHIYKYLDSTYEGRTYNIIELCCGKGQDLGRLLDMHASNILMIDVDATAIAELNKRMLSNKKSTSHITTQVIDLSQSYDTIIGEMKIKSAHIVNCNFALHYFMSTRDSFKNITKLVTKICESNGRFAFTCFDGAKIFKLLYSIKSGDTWSKYENDVLKYSIRKHYDDPTLLDYGQRIAVKHAFSMNEYYDEYLVNVSAVVSELEKYGFVIERYDGFETFDIAFNREAKLTHLDRMYNALYTSVIVYRPSKKLKTHPLITDIVNEQDLALYSKTLASYKDEFIKYQQHMNLLQSKQQKQELPIWLDDIHTSLPYLIDASHHTVFNLHRGQRKLLLQELFFLSEINIEPNQQYVMLYVGSAPGIHLSIYMHQFTNIKYILVDPAPFDKELSSTSRPTERSITKKSVVEADIRDFMNNDMRTLIINDYMIDDLATWLYMHKGSRHILYVSDIRRGASANEFESNVAEDNYLMLKWYFIMNPYKTMLKYRLPYKHTDIDFTYKNYVDDNEPFIYVDGRVLLQIWGPPTSTETRLLIDAYDSKHETAIQAAVKVTISKHYGTLLKQIGKYREYIHSDYDNKLAYFNIVVRKTWIATDKHIHDAITELIKDESLGYDGCWSCCAELHTLFKYINTFKIERDIYSFIKLVNKYCKTLVSPYHGKMPTLTFLDESKMKLIE